MKLGKILIGVSSEVKQREGVEVDGCGDCGCCSVVFWKGFVFVVGGKG